MCFRNQSFFSPGLVLFHMEVVERKERASRPPVDLQNTWSGLANGEGRCSDLQGAAQGNPFSGVVVFCHTGCAAFSTYPDRVAVARVFSQKSLHCSIIVAKV